MASGKVVRVDGLGPADAHARLRLYATGASRTAPGASASKNASAIS
jgi:hypothetical protein